MRPPPLLSRAVAAVAAGLALGAGVGACGGDGTHSPTTTARTVTAQTATATTPTTTVVLPGTGRPVVTVGDKNTPEQFVLGELYDLALSAEGFNVTLNRNIGPPSVSVQALEQGTLDVYPEYLNLWNSQVVGTTTTFPSLPAAYSTAQAYASAHQLQLLNPTRFSNTEGIAVLASYAHVHGLRSLADLLKVQLGLVLGAPLEFTQDPKGLPAIEQAYDFAPAIVEPVDIGSQYAELRSGSIQAAFVYTTDAQLLEPAFTLLRDPRHVLGFGNVVPVVSMQAIAAEGPTFAATINDVDALLTTKVMRQLNAAVTLYHEDPTSVARTFLEAHHLLPAPASR